jgi:predicted RND superfamily exporter protein
MILLTKILEFPCRRPVITLLMVALVSILLGRYAMDFRLDVSSDSLVLENDVDLKYYRSIAARYESDDFLVITYTANNDLFSKATLSDLRALQDKLEAMERVGEVVSLLTVPLLKSPPLSLIELQDDFRSIENPLTDLELARVELTTSPLYKNRLVSLDGKTTALLVMFKRDEIYQDLRQLRDELRAKQLEKQLSPEEQAKLKEVTEAFRLHSENSMNEQAADISTVRQIMDEHRQNAELHLGGVPMIVADMMQFIRNDIKMFGFGALSIMIVLLWLLFGRVRWVVLPIATACVSTLIVVGIIGKMGWYITVVSSNFLLLLVIFSLSITIHLVVRYRELHEEKPDADQLSLVTETIQLKFSPCAYTILTTIVAFSSLVVCDIRPVIDFGWIMVLGLIVCLLVAFTFFPAILVMLDPKDPPQTGAFSSALTALFAKEVQKHSFIIIIISSFLGIFSVWGIYNLKVDNRFIDYFKSSTEIYQGMKLIDEKLGGTTPLDIILDASKEFYEEKEVEDDYLEDDGFSTGQEQGISATSYWFNSYMLEQLKNVHEYVESLPDTGKVVSLATGLDIIHDLNDGESLETYELGVLLGRLPEETRQALVSPYLSEDGNQVRIAVRMQESAATMPRQKFLTDLKSHIQHEKGFAKEQVHLTGVAVLYNNMLQSLFRSQILTLGVVFMAIAAMFALVFRSLLVALLAIIPNLLAALLVLGFMGVFGIPLDIMTITIAAIVIGIGVDDAIHYLHRYHEEVQIDGDYKGAMIRSHQTIGKAMYYTSVVIVLGFSVLTLSNFIPSIWFGVLTAFAMLTALVANLSLLPLLLIMVKPWKLAKA